ncbi:MAG: flagellin N-terminal helical domain-containing protein [Blastococcus sp.]
MGLSLATNVTAFAANRSLAKTNIAMERSLGRLATGYRITRASDDASGLAISEGLRSQIGGMTQAVRNAQDGIGVVQTAEGALGETTSVLQRMRDLAVQAANDGALDAFDKDVIQKQMGQLQKQLNSIAGATNWDGNRLLDGTFNRSFQVGAAVGDTIEVGIGSAGHALDAAGLGVDSIDVTRRSGGATAAATVTPAVSAAQGTPTAGEISFAGDFTTPGTFETTYRNLAGTITYDGKTFDLGSVDYSGASTAADYLNTLFTAARAAFATAGVPGGITVGTGTASALTLTGDVPGAGSTTADAAALTPSYSGPAGVDTAIPAIDQAIALVSQTRAELGATENRFEDTIARLNVSLVNTTAAESRIRDTDMAQEMTGYSRSQVLTQSGTAMLAQATHAPEAILKLLT